MKFIEDLVPDVAVHEVEGEELFNITTMKSLDEQDDRVILRCAEHVDQLERGFTCDLVCNYNIAKLNGEDKEPRQIKVKDLVLVYINRWWDVEMIPQIEYVFYK